MALELRKRLVEVGTLSAPDDIFYLTTSELVDASKARTRGRAVAHAQQKVSSRRELREARKRVLPPEQVPVPDEEARKQNRQVRGHQILNDGASETLKGFACSPGKVTAEASVILSPDDFGKMKPGTILVCPMATAAWIQLFAQAKGLVTNIGGILSHGLIIAREYGIPAVLGVGDVTECIVSGQRITVDGDNGTVTILDN